MCVFEVELGARCEAPLLAIAVCMMPVGCPDDKILIAWAEWASSPAAEYHHHTRGRPNTVFQQSGQQFAHVHNQLGACSLCISPTPWGLLATGNPNSTLLHTG